MLRIPKIKMKVTIIKLKQLANKTTFFRARKGFLKTA